MALGVLPSGLVTKQQAYRRRERVAVARALLGHQSVPAGRLTTPADDAGRGAAALGLVCAGLSTPARADSPAIGIDGVRTWKEAAFNAVRILRASDADAARW